MPDIEWGRYQYAPHSPAQAGCPHRLRGHDGEECSTCGARKRDGRWWHLIPAWFAYYYNGAPRPQDEGVKEGL